MVDLSKLCDTSRPYKKVQRVGRGMGSNRGKTSCRGGKGDSARQGYRKRFGYEGGQVPLYRKIPVRGFTRGRFVKDSVAVSLAKIDAYYEEGEKVTLETLRAKGLIPRRVPGGLKILSNGELTKRVTIEAHRFSALALKKLEERAIPYTVLS
ncbi:MAG: 50S ribosomal protein L15 [Verrucomicrobiota bacterium]|nr:50S ribosomal protein L15 [Verrucomicrobiota bacterium]